MGGGASPWDRACNFVAVPVVFRSSCSRMAQARSCTVFVGNIPYDAQEDQLRNIFSRVGVVESFRLVFDKDTTQPKGYGFCDYSDADTALSAIRNLNDVDFNGRRLRIDLADNALRSREMAQVPLALPAPLLAQPAPPPAPPPVLPGSQPPTQMLALPPTNTLHPTPSVPWNVPTPAPQESDLGSSVNALESVISEISAHTEIAQTVSSMPLARLHLCLGAMQRLAVEAPESARALLQEHPELCYALLHAQLLLGLTSDPLPPPTSEDLHNLKATPVRMLSLPLLQSAGALHSSQRPLSVAAGLLHGNGMVQSRIGSGLAPLVPLSLKPSPRISEARLSPNVAAGIGLAAKSVPFSKAARIRGPDDL